MDAIKKIVITGGPGTGKTTLIDHLKDIGHTVLPEVSRSITLEAREAGIQQLFQTDPLLFSQKILEARTAQFSEADTLKAPVVYLDRGIVDVLAYLDSTQTPYGKRFKTPCLQHRYHQIFILPPWRDIYTEDNERYEDFELAQQIHGYIETAYKKYGYTPITVPIGPVAERCEYILNQTH